MNNSLISSFPSRLKRNLPSRKRNLPLSGGFIVAVLILTLLTQTQGGLLHTITNTQASTHSQTTLAASDLSRQPLRFEANQDSSTQEVSYISRGQGYSLSLSATEAVFSLQNGKSQQVKNTGVNPSPSELLKAKTLLSQPKSPTNDPIPAIQASPAVVRMRLVGANSMALAHSQDELASNSNYFTGNDPTKWRTNVAGYGKVTFEKVYPGTDLIYYGNGRQLEYDFDLAPGADPHAIRLSFSGNTRLAIGNQGELVLNVDGKELQFQAPQVYQKTNGVKQSITGHYSLEESTSPGASPEVSFTVGNYDTTRPLVIDPVLVYSTYFGGSVGDYGLAITADSAGNAYVIGYTKSTNFPLKNAYETAYNGGTFDTFVAKFDPSGDLLYSTYFGGNSYDYGYGIKVDSSGDAYIVGVTASTNFPLKNAYQPVYGGSLEDAFVAKLDPSGGLLFSTYFGGNGIDYGFGITLDSSNGVYITGYTQSTNFPLKTSYQSSLHGIEDAYVAKFDSNGSLLFSTYFGGSGADESYFGIGVDSSNSFFITGSTNSSDLPLKFAYQATPGGDNDAFVARFDSNGGLIYSTYFGGNHSDIGYGIAIDGSDNAYITGTTTSTNFPVKNAYQPVYGGNYGDGFIAKFNNNGGLVYSTYFGGSGTDTSRIITVDNSGKAFITGFTDSTNFPLKNAYQATSGGGDDAFVAGFDTNGGLLYSTYLGGSDNDIGSAIAVDNSGNAYITGSTSSTNFPLANAYQVSIGDTLQGDSFVTKMITGTVKTCVANNTSDNGVSAGSLRNALLQSPQCDIINLTFAGATTITITGTPLPPIPVGVIINGVCSGGQPIVTLQGSGVNGLNLSGGDTLNCLKINGFTGEQLKATGGNGSNHLFRVLVSKN